MWEKISKISVAFTIVVGTNLLTISPQVVAQGETQDTLPAKEIGFEILGSSTLNQVVIPVYQYVGECPGRKIGSARAMFTSSEIPPGRDMRVLVRNVSRGLAGDPFPYTDRKYDRGRSSESTDITFGSEHRGRYFVAVRGRNTYEYEIREGKSVVERGSFTAEVFPSEAIIIQRDKEPKEEKYCVDGRPLYNCHEDNIRVRVVYRCPRS